MKKNFLTAAVIGLGLVGLGGRASAHDSDYRDDRRSEYHQSHSYGNLRSEIDHVNRMYAHVRWQLRSYNAGRHLWREYEHLSGEVRQLNYEFNRGYADRYRLRGEVEHIHGELHHIEVELRVRESDYYRWR